MNTPKKILVVDDDVLSSDFFDLMLSRLGFVVEKAHDGKEALEKVKKFFPDLIMLDNIMPNLSGWEVTKILKSDPKFKEIPIIMFSAIDDVKDKVEGFELGVDDYITKPFNFAEVLSRIKVVLRNREFYAQIKVRETRLALAEDLSTDIKKNLLDFVKTIDELDVTIALMGSKSESNGENSADLFKAVSEKSGKVRKHVAELDARIEKTISEWDRLKKSEIGLSQLETQIRNNLSQE